MDSSAIRALVDTFNAAWGDHDLDAALALITDDCLFDATGPQRSRCRARRVGTDLRRRSRAVHD
jgi:uncharacterized protein (TIGR02246 family)